MNRQITIILADDHTLMRDMLVRQFSETPDIVVAAAVESADQAIEQAALLRPDVVLMDIDMPGVECFTAARTIQAQEPDTRVVFLSAFFHDRYIEQALAVQAVGYLIKSEPLDTLLQAIRTIACGGSYFSPQIRARMVFASNGARLMQEGRSRASTLTPRELEILRYLSRGLSQKEIANTLHVSARTVHTHANKVMRKLDIHDRVALARFAIREGLADA